MEQLSVAELVRRLLDSLLFILSESQHKHSPGTERLVTCGVVLG